MNIILAILVWAIAFLIGMIILCCIVGWITNTNPENMDRGEMPSISKLRFGSRQQDFEVEPEPELETPQR